MGMIRYLYMMIRAAPFWSFRQLDNGNCQIIRSYSDAATSIPKRTNFTDHWPSREPAISLQKWIKIIILKLPRARSGGYLFRLWIQRWILVAESQYLGLLENLNILKSKIGFRQTVQQIRYIRNPEIRNRFRLSEPWRSKNYIFPQLYSCKFEVTYLWLWLESRTLGWWK